MRVEFVELFESLCLLDGGTDAHFAGHRVRLCKEVGVRLVTGARVGGGDEGRSLLVGVVGDEIGVVDVVVGGGVYEGRGGGGVGDVVGGDDAAGTTLCGCPFVLEPGVDGLCLPVDAVSGEQREEWECATFRDGQRGLCVDRVWDVR